MELFPITEGKLAVSIADEVLILHSPTEKQLSAYLEQNTLPAAAELVLSANHLSSGESMAQYAEAAGAQHIIIAASSEKGLRSHKGLDVQSTYKEGEIARQFKRSNTWRQENQTKRKITADPRPEKRRICHAIHHFGRGKLHEGILSAAAAAEGGGRDLCGFQSY